MNYRVFMGDSHVHPAPGRGPRVQQVIQMAQDRQTDFIGLVTRHGLRNEQDWTSESIGVLTGTEIACGGAIGLHLVVYRTPYGVGKVHLNELVERAHAWCKLGAAIVVAHPWTIFRDRRPDRILRVLDEVAHLGTLHAVELVNGGFDADTIAGWEQIVDRYARVWMSLGVGVTGGSDWHDSGTGGVLGSGHTYLMAEQNSPLARIEALRAGRAAGGICRAFGSINSANGFATCLARTQRIWPDMVWKDVIGPPDLVKVIADQASRSEEELTRQTRTEHRTVAGMAIGAGNYRLALNYLSEIK